MDPLELLRQGLQGEAAVLFALQFGSRTQHGQARIHSDWDVGVYLSDELTRKERFDLCRVLAARFEPAIRLDLVVLNDAPPLLAQRALLGQRLFVRDRKAYVSFVVRTLAAAGDEAYWRRLHAEARQRRLEEGVFGRP